LAHLASQAQRRRERMRSMCERLEKLRLPGKELLRTVESQPGVPTRTHLAAALVAGGHATTPADAFRRYLAQGKPGYRSAQWPPLAEVVSWIQQAGGKACLAHPLRYRVSSGARRQLVAEFAAMGGAGLEVVTGNNALQHIDTCAALAVKFKLAGSVGSDFHDPARPWNALGRLAKLPPHVKPLWDNLIR
jgi:predicted metal-dependent phosphoesterase TrpH